MWDWQSLAAPWQACYELAWEAYCDGCVPVGAVAVDRQGKILSRGRNRSVVNSAPPGQIAGDTLAHAELNALLSLDNVSQTVRHRATIYTTMEPCPLCLGAIYMSGVRSIYYAARDSYAGSTNLLGASWYLGQKPVKASGPLDRVSEALILAVHVEYDLREHGGIKEMENNKVIRRWSSVVPSAIRLGTRLYQTRILAEMREQGLPASQVFNRLAHEFES